MDSNNKGFIERITDKRVLFITTKNIDYIRNTQELRVLRENARDVKVLFSSQKKYIGRIIEIWIRLLFINLDEIDTIFIGFAPQLILPFYKWKMKNKEVIIDFFISLYDTLVCDRKIVAMNGVIARVCHCMDYVTLKETEYAITDTKADAEYFIKEFQSDALKFETIYLEADKNVYYPREQHKREDLEKKYVVLYFGSILPLQGVDIVLDTVRMLKDEEKIFFQIIGPIHKTYDKPIQNNVEYIDWLNQSELAEYIANADLCLAGHFCGNIDKAKRTIPGKAYIYKMMEKKMILGDSKANRELYHKNDNNIKFVEMGNPKSLVKAILECVL